MYQIFPDRFNEGHPGKTMPFADRIYREDKTGEPYFWPTEQADGYLNRDYFGGDFEGIRQKLPYLKHLGVTCIYLNPIFEAHSNHRYNTANYLKPDPVLGTTEEFTRMCVEAAQTRHPHHSGRRVQPHGQRQPSTSTGRAATAPAAPTATAIPPTAPGTTSTRAIHCGYRSWWGFETLPEVEEDDPSYVEFICGKGGVIDTWLSLGASGFRLDVADELPDDFIEKILPGRQGPRAGHNCSSARCGRTPPPRRPSAGAAPTCGDTGWTPP